MIRSIFNKYYQNLLIVILISLLAVFAVTCFIAINNIVSEQSKIQQQSVSPVYALVNRELLKPLHIAETFAETITFNGLLDGGAVDQDLILEQLARMEKRLNLTFFVALENERVQLMSNGRQFDLIEGQVYWYFEALKSDNRILADLGQVGDVHLFFDVRIYSDDGDFLGFVGVGKRIKHFVDTFASYKETYNYDFLFVNENDQVILTSLPDLVVTDEFIPSLASLAWFEDGQMNLQNLDSQIVEHDGLDTLITEIQIPQLNWRLLLLVPLAERQAKLTRTFVVNAVLASTVIIVTLSIMFFLFVTYKRHLEKKLEIDNLTGLVNRSYLHRRFNRLHTTSTDLCVAIVDLDHFKQVNDNYGHNAGDLVLRQVANILTSVLRADDTVCRWGGEEFVLMLPNTSADNCMALLERARLKFVETPVVFAGNTIEYSASFGIVAGNSKDQLSKLLGNADVALYESKRQGRNRVTLYSE
ncbi:diguanylate cyclase [Alteromonas sp. ASW11-36]|uniref:diguanylate cyclase n=1 Tax=Alteromonas arenosi TaxID=3055817 RepID=A0ABT7SXF2_9ALTE|nr:diguanylate cyclase [Alteromonas sp. ASW11-36]MDM7860853.1 diguanylate cyclase [Alteromonas sp. ASW11-36]